MKIITVKSASKRFNLANIRCGWCCGSEKIIRELNQWIVARSASIPKFVTDLVLYSFSQEHSVITSWNEESYRRFLTIRDCIETINREAGRIVLKVEHEPQSGHGVILNLDALIGKKLHNITIRSSLDLCQLALKHFKLALSPGDSMGYRGCKIRIAISSVGLPFTYDREFDEKHLVADFLKGSLNSDSLKYIRPKLEGLEKGRQLLKEIMLGKFKTFILELEGSFEKNYLHS